MKGTMRNTLRWVGVILAATTVDLGVRFGLAFDLTRVLWTEAVLFPATALALALLIRRAPGATPRGRALQWILVAAFVLAGLRSGLWAAGVPVATANLVILAIGGIALVGALLRARRSRRETP